MSKSNPQLPVAVAAVVMGGLKLREAAKKYNVPFSTLQWRVANNRTEDVVRKGSKPAFSQEIESKLVEAIHAFKKLGYGLSRKEVLYIASELDHQRPEESRAFGENGATDSWFRRFKHRQGLSLRTPENKSIARYSAEGEDVELNLRDQYKAIVQKYKLQPSQIYNVDETGFQIVTKNPKILCNRGDKEVCVRKSGERSQTITVEACGNASGSVIIPPCVVFKGQSLPGNLNTKSYPDESIFCLSKSGYMNTPLFYNWLEFFIAHIPPKRPVLLILDGHKSHASLAVLKTARENNIMLFCLPPHSTHLYQPLDVVVFASMKTRFKAICAEKMRKYRGKKLNIADFGKLLNHVWKYSMTPANLIAGFTKSGFIEKKSDKRSKNPNVLSTSSTNVSSNSSTSESSNSSTNVLSTSSTSGISSLQTSSSSSNPSTSTVFHSDGSLSPTTEPIVPLSTSTPQHTLSVSMVIRSMLQPSPEKCEESSARIKFAVSLTSDEYMGKVAETKNLADAKEARKEDIKKRKLEREHKKLEKANAAEAKKETRKRKSEKVLKIPAKKPKMSSKEPVIEVVPDSRRRLFVEPVTEDEVVPDSRRLQATSIIESPPEVELGSWIVVEFQVDSSKTRKYLGQLIKCKNGKLVADFVRPVVTKNQKGKVFKYPDVRDDCTPFSFSNIVRIIPDPKNFGRGMLEFPLDVDSILK